MTRYREVLALVVTLVAAGCASTPPPGTTPSGAAPVGSATSPLPYPTAFSSELLGPMGALGECPEVDEPSDAPSAEGLLMPDGTVVQRVDDADDLNQVQGFVPLTPVQLLDHFLHRDDITLITLEHEQFESETLYETARYRVFVKAQVACATGSNFVAVIAPAEAASELPTPSGAPGG